MAFVIRAVVKGVSNGIGLAGEKYHDHKKRKVALAEQDISSTATPVEAVEAVPVPPYSSTDDAANDERIWALDEAAGDPPAYEALNSHTSRPAPDRTISELVHDTVGTTHPEEWHVYDRAVRLPYPVIIPQRRPGTKARGFARAYPPDLEAFSIDENTFLSFLGNFHEASQASPWLNAVFIAAGAVGFVPSHITLAVSISVQFAAGTAIEIQSRYKANAFLDQMNKDLFMPMGLYAMILLCKDGPGTPNQPIFGVETNEDAEIEGISKTSKVLRPIRLTSGQTNVSDMAMEIAPLIYPGLEDMIERPAVKRDESFKDRLMRNKEFVADYFDRRAKAEYMGNNPDTALTKASSEMPQFQTRFADPNHPCNNGHLFSLVTGGKYVAQPLGRRRRLREVGEDGKLKPRVNQKHKIRGPVSLVAHGVRKVFQKNILYLTIVNMPSEEELAEARNALGLDNNMFKDFFEPK
ncbi:hypothetical protein CC78DRAFT_463803 [Lojkania enalia]|uniref:Uncharacterized protein n=1 Tax=Lojkania enalia TaxID=147567 RepID=A0A9P4N3D8_9PLEO|nr:hypothetical protein CC78DRAFT_463803 [Didymosphaeria enalia]